MAHHKNLLWGEGGRIAAQYINFENPYCHKWKLLDWHKWDLNLSSERHFLGKIGAKIGWMLLAHHKNLIMGEGGRIAGPVHKVENPYCHNGSC